MIRQGGKFIGGMWLIAALVMLPLTAFARQDDSQLEILNPANGTLDASTPTVTYTFSLSEGFVFSLNGWNRSGDLALEMTVFDAAGAIVVEGTPLDESAAVVSIEAITVPAATTYSVKLSAINGTSGEYGLMLMPGYSYVEKWDEFEAEEDEFALTWDEATTPTETGVVDGRLRVVTDEPNTVT